MRRPARCWCRWRFFTNYSSRQDCKSCQYAGVNVICCNVWERGGLLMKASASRTHVLLADLYFKCSYGKWMKGQRATNKPKKLPVLRQLQGLRLHPEDIPGKSSCSVFAPTCQMPRLYATSHPAAPAASSQASRRGYRAYENGPSYFGQEDGETCGLGLLTKTGDYTTTENRPGQCN